MPVTASSSRSCRYARLGLLSFSFSALFAFTATAAPVHLLTEHTVNPLGIDVQHPRFAWQSDAKTADWMQTAYQITVATDERALKQGKGTLWDSGRIASSDSINIAYNGPALKPRQRYLWTVRVWDKEGKSSTSSPAWFETGLMTAEAWQAKWIRHEDPAADKELADVRWIWPDGEDAKHVPPTVSTEFRYVLHLDTKPQHVSLQVAVLGEFVARVNGRVTGEHTKWSAFDYEPITQDLKYGAGTAGDNEIVVNVKTHKPKAPATTSPAAFAATIHITTQDGSTHSIVSEGKNWSARTNGAAWKPAIAIAEMSAPMGVTVNLKQRSGPGRIVTDASLLRKDFSITAGVRSARLYITALGAYRAFINGKPVAADALLDPGFTDFRKRVLYQTYDVTSMVKKGDNALAALLGGGWHSSPLTWAGNRDFPGPDLLRAQLEITLTDGSRKIIATDNSWKTAASPILSSEIYGGEVYDARAEVAGWNQPGFTAKGWSNAVAETVGDQVQVTAQPDLSIHSTITLHPASMDTANNAHPYVYDMGQNMVGNIALHVRGPRGTVVRLRYAERLNPDGSIYIENLRNATVTDFYTLSGNGDETYIPSFTFHGFRYVEVLGYPGTPNKASIDGLVYNSLPNEPSIRFSSGSELLDSMGHLGFWGQRGNFVSIPTDCPQRDERMGWMGDAGVFWRTGTYNFDIASFTHKFMMDIDDAQTENGSFSDISPNLLEREQGAPGWSDAGVLVPYAAWQQYGDTSVIERSWPQMEHFMDFIQKTNPDYLRKRKLGNNYADWLAPDPHTPKDLIATAYWAISARDMKEMATALGHTTEAEKYQKLYENIVAAYRKEYIAADGSVKGNTQTAYVATLFAGIATENERKPMTDRLVKDIEAHQNHLTTGFLGTPFLMFVLDENHRSDVAFNLLMQETYPSWGYMVKKGATTWWERWNGDTGDPSMNSYNHYAFGSVMAWVFRRVAGIDTDNSGAGYHRIVIKPHFDARIPKLHTEYDSAYGTVSTEWDSAVKKFIVTTPANTTAVVTLPGGKTEQVGSGTHTYSIQ